MTAPDQCCINGRKLLSIRRRPHMTQSGHERAAFAAMHGSDLLYLKSLALGKAHEAAGVHRASWQWCGGVAVHGALSYRSGRREPQRSVEGVRTARKGL